MESQTPGQIIPWKPLFWGVVHVTSAEFVEFMVEVTSGNLASRND